MVETLYYTRLAPPKKPYADFPLFAHQNGQWAKKIKRKLRYFGPWNDWRAALDLYLLQRDDLHAGRTPRTTPDAKTFGDLADAFVASKRSLAERGERSDRTPEDYEELFKQVASCWGRNITLEHLASTDGKNEFATLREFLARTHSPITLANDIQRIRTLFNWGYEHDFLEQPIKYGDSFKKPPKKAQRRQRNQRPKKFFPPEEIRLMLDQANPTLRAMFYLGINCGFGNDDCATITESVLDLENGWHTHARPKTEIERRCSLWPTTVEAIRAVLGRRPSPANPSLSDRVFLTNRGNSWESSRRDSPISKETAKLLERLNIRRRGVNFKALRHTFQTIGEEVDYIATRYIMGHADESISAHYREGVRDHRLKKVTDHVYAWLTDDETT